MTTRELKCSFDPFTSQRPRAASQKHTPSLGPSHGESTRARHSQCREERGCEALTGGAHDHAIAEALEETTGFSRDRGLRKARPWPRGPQTFRGQCRTRWFYAQDESEQREHWPEAAKRLSMKAAREDFVFVSTVLFSSELLAHTHYVGLTNTRVDNALTCIVITKFRL